MLENEENSTSPATTEAAPPSARPRRRAASRPSGPPPEVTVTPEAAPTTVAAAEVAAPVDEPTEQTSEAPAPTRRRRAATKPAGEPAPVPAAESVPETAPAVEAAPVAEEPVTVAAEVPAETESPVRRTRRRATRPTAAPEPVDAAAIVVEEPAVQVPADDELTGEEPVAEQPADADLVTDESAAIDVDADAETAEAVETATGEAESSDEDSSNDESSHDDESSEEASDDAPRRRRRRRGGRRRRRSSDDSASDDSSTDDNGDDADDQHTDTATDSSSDSAGDHAPDADDDSEDSASDGDDDSGTGPRRRRRRRRRRGEDTGTSTDDDSVEVVVRVREPRAARSDEVTGIEGSTRMEAKRQRRREGRQAGRRRTPVLSEAEFLARRESVKREMVIRQNEELTQIAVLEDDMLVEHYVDRDSAVSLIGNVYLGRVQNVLPSMEAAFIDIGRGRNAVLYAGEIDWASFGEAGESRQVEKILKSGQTIMVQVTKDPVGAKGARLTHHISMPGRYVVYSPGGHLSGISRKLPDTERQRLREILSNVVDDAASVIVRTAAEGVSEDELVHDVNRLKAQWEAISKQVKGAAPRQLYSEPDLTVRIVRDLFTEDFTALKIDGNDADDDAYETVRTYVEEVAPHLADRIQQWDRSRGDIFGAHRIDEQISKAMERKVHLPSGGSLVIDRTEAMTVIDVNTGKFTGTGGNLEATVTSNNLEAAEEVVRQLRLRDIGGIIVIDFIDMVLPSNRELLLRRLVECLGRDRTRHQVAEVTSLGLVQMTRKKIGTGLESAFSEPCEACQGRGYHVHTMPVAPTPPDGGERRKSSSRSRRNKGGQGSSHHHESKQAEPKAEAEQQPQSREELMKVVAATVGNGNGNAQKAEDAPTDSGAEATAEATPVTSDEPQTAAAKSARTADKGKKAADQEAEATASEGEASIEKPATEEAVSEKSADDQPDSDQPDSDQAASEGSASAETKPKTTRRRSTPTRSTNSRSTASRSTTGRTTTTRRRTTKKPEGEAAQSESAAAATSTESAPQPPAQSEASTQD